MTIEKAVALAEQCFDELSSALVSGEPEALAASSANMQRAAMNLAALVNRILPQDPQTQALKSRLDQLSNSLGIRRESLIRRTVLVDRALNALVPATVKSTYGPSHKAYSAVGPQTGAFKYLAA